MAHQGAEEFSSSQSINQIDLRDYSTKNNLALEGIFPRSMFDPQSFQQNCLKRINENAHLDDLEMLIIGKKLLVHL